MKLIYAKLWVKKYLRYNPGSVRGGGVSNRLNRAITHLSHRVHRKHGMEGHNGRQDIRRKLRRLSLREGRHGG